MKLVEKYKDINFIKIGILCGSLFLFAFIFAYGIFPPILRAILRSQVILKPGTQMRDMYDELPFPMIFKIHLFHVLNPDDVMQGKKPKLEERGPYVFELWKSKTDQEEDVVEDTIIFESRNKYIFSKELSNGLTGDEEIVILHPLNVAIPLVVNNGRAALLPMINKGLAEILRPKPNDIFYRGPVMNILFNGIEIDCSSQDFNAKTLCSTFSTGEIKTISPSEKDDIYLFSLFGNLNGSSIGKFKTFRGIKNISDLGRVILFNDEPELDVWDGDECNEIIGTDSTIFPPFMTKEQGLWTFEAFLCRSVQVIYERPSKYSGLPTLHYIMDFGDIPGDERLHCFCPDDECPPKGTMNLFPCQEAPITVSLPHFYNADPEVVAKIESGLAPDKEKHMIYVDLEIISGTPLSAAKRVQINYDLKPLSDIDYMHDVPEMLFPLLWVEEGVNLNKTFVNMLKYQLFLGLKVRAVVKWLCIIVGFFGACGSGLMHYMQRNVGRIEVTQVTTKNENKNVRSIESAETSRETSDKHEPDITERY